MQDKKDSPASAASKMADYATDLNLPSAPRDMPLRPFRPEDLPALYKMIDLYLPQVVSQPDYEERRLASKCREPFVWKD